MIQYKGREVIEVRKVPWDELWHIVYKSKTGESYHRVKQTVALEVANRKHVYLETNTK